MEKSKAYLEQIINKYCSSTVQKNAAHRHLNKLCTKPYFLAMDLSNLRNEVDELRQNPLVNYLLNLDIKTKSCLDNLEIQVTNLEERLQELEEER